jgi:predicted acyltransferase
VPPRVRAVRKLLAASFLVAMKGLTGMAGVDWLADQMTHPAWNGFTFYDFLFPLFLFLAGVSLSFSLGKRTAMGSSHGDLYRKAFIRFLTLYVSSGLRAQRSRGSEGRVSRAHREIPRIGDAAKYPACPS